MLDFKNTRKKDCYKTAWGNNIKMDGIKDENGHMLSTIFQ